MRNELNKFMAPTIQQALWTVAILSGVATAFVVTYVGLIAVGVPLPIF